ncbi:MAG TPA: hypothetical protein VIK57_25210 [Streptosporangiaceae bacterium]
MVDDAGRLVGIVSRVDVLCVCPAGRTTRSATRWSRRSNDALRMPEDRSRQAFPVGLPAIRTANVLLRWAEGP